jgi:hypothetical protein
LEEDERKLRESRVNFGKRWVIAEKIEEEGLLCC